MSDISETSSVSLKKQGSLHNYWCFTYNNYSNSDISILITLLKVEATWYVFQEEIGECGTPHLQGTVYFKLRKRLSNLKKFNAHIHWEPTRAIDKSVLYCTKEETRSGEIYYHGIDIPKPIEIEEPSGWQLEVVNIIKEKPEKRKIHWFWEPKGGVGKSELCKYLVVKHGAILVGGSRSNMYHCIIKSKKKDLIIINIPRDDFDKIDYGGLEQIKDGLFFSGKYDSEVCVFNIPHVIVFANYEPQYHSLSKDRLVVHRIEGD